MEGKERDLLTSKNNTNNINNVDDNREKQVKQERTRQNKKAPVHEQSEAENEKIQKKNWSNNLV